MKPLTLRILVADDHSVVRAGIHHVLEAAGGALVVGSARNSSELMELLVKVECDVLISGYAMPGGRHGDGMLLFRLLRQRFPALRIVVLTMLDNPGIVHSLLKLGITCILSKSDSMSHLMPAVHVAYAEGRYLSPTIAEIAESITSRHEQVHALSGRELEVIRLYVSGMTVNEIASRLNRSKKTISTQKGAAMLKLGIKRDLDLLRYGLESGLVRGDIRPMGLRPH